MVLGMGDGSMTTLTIADPEKDGIRKEHKIYTFQSILHCKVV